MAQSGESSPTWRQPAVSIRCFAAWRTTCWACSSPRPAVRSA